MKTKNNIIVIGDLHTNFSKLNQLINKKKPKIVLSTGDFGIFSKFEGSKLGLPPMIYSLDNIKPGPYCRIYIAFGNHDDWSILRDVEDDFKIVAKNTYAMKRFSYITLIDGRTVLFVGGAESTDSAYRIPEHDYWIDEVLLEEDMYSLPDITIDIIISHTCPKEFVPIKHPRRTDPTEVNLSKLLYLYRPKLWYFSHFHTYKTGYFKKTRTKWVCLNMCGRNRWWDFLE